ncbi:hypothetical protein NKH77_51265 [Streptomyces sp. M19]
MFHALSAVAAFGGSAPPHPLPGELLSQIPVSDVDLYTESARIDPYDIYAGLRDLGPVVYLSRYDLYALPRYDEVRAALMDWQTFSSARGVFVDQDVNAQLEGSRCAVIRPSTRRCAPCWDGRCGRTGCVR